MVAQIWPADLEFDIVPWGIFAKLQLEFPSEAKIQLQLEVFMKLTNCSTFCHSWEPVQVILIPSPKLKIKICRSIVKCCKYSLLPEKKFVLQSLSPFSANEQLLCSTERPQFHFFLQWINHVIWLKSLPLREVHIVQLLKLHKRLQVRIFLFFILFLFSATCSVCVCFFFNCSHVVPLITQRLYKFSI